MIYEPSHHHYMTDHQDAKFKVVEDLVRLGVPRHEVLEGGGVHLLQPLHVPVGHVRPGLAFEQHSVVKFGLTQF